MVPLKAARKSTWPQAALDRKWPQVEFWTSGSLGARVLGLRFGIEVSGAKLKGLRFYGLGLFWFFPRFHTLDTRILSFPLGRKIPGSSSRAEPEA